MVISRVIVVTFLFVIIMAVGFVGMAIAVVAYLFGCRGLPTALAIIATALVICLIVGVRVLPVTMVVMVLVIADFLVVMVFPLVILMAAMVACRLRCLGE